MKGNLTILTVFGAVLLLLWNCKGGSKPVVNNVAVAKVYDKYLYTKDIQHIFPKNVTKQDSIELAQSYINTWIKNQLILRKAEMNLSPEELDIQEQLDNYRSSLLIYKYEEQMVKQKTDTTFTEEELKKYYDENTPNFVLDESLVKALYLKIPKTAPDIENVKTWYKSNNKEDIKKLDSYCYNYATKYDYFENQWVSFSLIKRELPKNIDDETEYLKNNNFIELEDAGFYYLVYIKDKNLAGSLAPYAFTKGKIKDILLNKRKVKFLSDLETNIFNDAQDHNSFEIYNIEKK
ncbi:MAG TPA: peptidylprolyl isomerase [Bacteroidales bacterium]|nr:peptidylprolyl isomerase [Bacteroidales bacterium]